MSTVILRCATPAEAGSLTEIAFAAKGHWGYPVEWMELWRPDLMVTPNYLETEKVWVAENNGTAVGFAGLSWGDHGRHIEHLWVLPEHIGRGLGRRLFAEMIETARKEGVGSLFICSDPNAEAFYVKMGAVRIGQEIYLLPDRTRREVPLLVYHLH